LSSQSSGTTETAVHLLRHAPENRSGPKAVKGKWLKKILKLTTRLKNKTWTNPQIKNHKTATTSD
jgi:hypothetical protein